MPDLVRVLIVDDHLIVRAGLTSLLYGTEGIEIVGQAQGAAEAVVLAGELRPDVVLLDVKMQGGDGLEAVPKIRAVAPRAAVVILTMFDDAAFLARAVATGASGYLLKGIERDDLVTAIRRAARGDLLFDPALVPGLLRQLHTDQVVRGDRGRQLTRREREVLAAIARGSTNTEIAQSLSVSLETVKTHVQRVLHKLGVTDRTQAAVYAVQHGLDHVPSGSSDERSR